MIAQALSVFDIKINLKLQFEFTIYKQRSDLFSIKYRSMVIFFNCLMVAELLIVSFHGRILPGISLSNSLSNRPWSLDIVLANVGF